MKQKRVVSLNLIIKKKVSIHFNSYILLLFLVKILIIFIVIIIII
jgi:hypothetical protein